MKLSSFIDEYRGNGFLLSGRNWSIALRWRWHFYFVRPPAKPGYSRLYIGPFEFERRKLTNTGIKEGGEA